MAREILFIPPFAQENTLEIVLLFVGILMGWTGWGAIF
jgi:hypothetical protein